MKAIIAGGKCSFFGNALRHQGMVARLPSANTRNAMNAMPLFLVVTGRRISSLVV